jgi:hypothetical protein
MKNTYLALAVAGTVLPYYFFLQQLPVSGTDIVGFMTLGFANPVAAGFSTDLVISSFVFWVYMFSAGPGAPRPWPFIALNLLVGLSCALPAYLFWRARAAEVSGGEARVA